MLKRPITYKDFDGEEFTEDFYFNISMAELVELETERKGGLSSWLEQIIKTEDVPAVMKEFKKFILLAYGIKSADGKSFVKNDELREQFSYTAAYDSLFWELFKDEGKFADFIAQVVPKEAADKAAEKIAETQTAVSTGSHGQTPSGAPPVPTTKDQS